MQTRSLANCGPERPDGDRPDGDQPAAEPVGEVLEEPMDVEMGRLNASYCLDPPRLASTHDNMTDATNMQSYDGAEEVGASDGRKDGVASVNAGDDTHVAADKTSRRQDNLEETGDHNTDLDCDMAAESESDSIDPNDYESDAASNGECRSYGLSQDVAQFRANVTFREDDLERIEPPSSQRTATCISRSEAVDEAVKLMEKDGWTGMFPWQSRLLNSPFIYTKPGSALLACLAKLRSLYKRAPVLSWGLVEDEELNEARWTLPRWVSQVAAQNQFFLDHLDLLQQYHGQVDTVIGHILESRLAPRQARKDRHQQPSNYNLYKRRTMCKDLIKRVIPMLILVLDAVCKLGGEFVPREFTRFTLGLLAKGREWIVKLYEPLMRELEERPIQANPDPLCRMNIGRLYKMGRIYKCTRMACTEIEHKKKEKDKREELRHDLEMLALELDGAYKELAEEQERLDELQQQPGEEQQQLDEEQPQLNGEQKRPDKEQQQPDEEQQRPDEEQQRLDEEKQQPDEEDQQQPDEEQPRLDEERQYREESLRRQERYKAKMKHSKEDKRRRIDEQSRRVIMAAQSSSPSSPPHWSKKEDALLFDRLRLSFPNPLDLASFGRKIGHDPRDVRQRARMLLRKILKKAFPDMGPVKKASELRRMLGS